MRPVVAQPQAYREPYRESCMATAVASMGSKTAIGSVGKRQRSRDDGSTLAIYPAFQQANASQKALTQTRDDAQALRSGQDRDDCDAYNSDAVIPDSVDGDSDARALDSTLGDSDAYDSDATLAYSVDGHGNNTLVPLHPKITRATTSANQACY